MSVNLSQKDWLLISAYLDARLSPPETKAFEERLQNDADLNQALLELRYTKKMLAALPTRRAPRNFTLSSKQVKKSLSQRVFQPTLSFVSAGAAIAFAAVFMITLFAPRASALPAAEAPMMAYAPEAAMEMAQDSASPEGTQAPQIIQWNPQEGMTAKSGADTTAMGGGGEIPLPAPVSVESGAANESTSATLAPGTVVDPANLILGIQESTQAADELGQRSFSPQTPRQSALPASTLWMIVLVSLSVLSGAAALLLRRR